MSFLFSMIYCTWLSALLPVVHSPFSCTLSVSISSGSSSVKSLHVNRADTIQVRINCLSMCKPVLESEEVEIQALDSGKFILKPRKAGTAKFQILSECPPNTSVEMGGKLLNVSGRMPVHSWSLDVNK